MSVDTYRELFVMYEEHPLGGDNVGFICSECSAVVNERPCPEHGPGERVGPLVLVPCDTSPRHLEVYVVDRDDYGTPCMYCAYESIREDHAPCAHSHHWPWRRWKITGRVSHRLAVLGVLGGGGSWTLDGHCDGCHTWNRPFAGKRTYILGKSRDWWRCLIQGRHIQGEQIGLGYCGKCLPCPTCGSGSADHPSDCGEQS